MHVLDCIQLLVFSAQMTKDRPCAALLLLSGQLQSVIARWEPTFYNVCQSIIIMEYFQRKWLHQQFSAQSASLPLVTGTTRFAGSHFRLQPSLTKASMIYSGQCSLICRNRPKTTRTWLSHLQPWIFLFYCSPCTTGVRSICSQSGQSWIDHF